MSLYLYDTTGYKGELANNKGYEHLSKWLKKNGFFLTKELIETGYTEFPEEVALEIEMGMSLSTEYWNDDLLKDMVDNLMSLLLTSKGVAIISDGVQTF